MPHPIRHQGPAPQLCTFLGAGVTVLGLLLLTLALDFAAVILVKDYPLEDAGSHCAPEIICRDTKTSLPLPTQRGEAAGCRVSLPASLTRCFPVCCSPICPHPVPTAALSSYCAPPSFSIVLCCHCPPPKPLRDLGDIPSTPLRNTARII